MPQIPGIPKRPQYNSVEAYLSELAKDIAEMVVDPVKMERFREQLKIYADFWKQWSTFDKADRQGCWEPSMGRPEWIFNIFSRSYNFLKDTEKEAKRLAGSYALCALIYESQLSHLDKIDTDIIPVEAVAETLSAPRNTLEGRSIGPWNSGLDVREIYLIEEFFNRVNVDLQEFGKSEENKLTQASIEGQIQQASQLSDEEFLELTAKKFEERAKKVLSKDETWHDLNRLLKGWFDAAVERLKKSEFPENDIGLLEYHYKNLLYYTRGINTKSFRGFPDSRIKQLASNQASELAEKFKKIDIVNKNYKPKKGSYKAQQILAIEEANKLTINTTQHPNKDIFLLYSYATQALGYSVDIAKITRCKVSLSVEQFVAKQVRLFEYIKQIENYPNITNILESWPINPGITFAWLAGQNALDVAVKFAQMISTNVLVARNERAFQGVTSYDDLMVCPEPDPAFERWQNRTIIEIVTRSLPKPDIWPNMSDIHREYESLCYKLKDEYKQAIEVKNQKLSETEAQGNNDKKKEEDIEPKPPEILQNILWLKKYGRKYWKLVAVSVFFLLCIWVLPKINLFSKKHQDIHSEAKTSDESSPAIITSGPNSPVTVNYDSPESKVSVTSKLLTPSDFRIRLVISAYATAYEYGYTPPEKIQVYGRAGSASFKAKLSLETPTAREYSRGRDPHRWWEYEDKAPIVTGLNSKCTLNSLVGETIKAHVPIRVFNRKDPNLWQFQLYIYISGREFMKIPNDDGNIEIKLTQDNLAIES